MKKLVTATTLTAGRRLPAMSPEEGGLIRSSGDTRFVTRDTGTTGLFIASHAFELGGPAGAVGCVQIHPNEPAVAAAATAAQRRPAA